MLTRIVKMQFRNNEIQNFKLLFESVKSKIEACNGCLGVKLVQDIENPEIFFTLSQWESSSDLENYRNSDLFADTWKKTKVLFHTKAMAWSTTEIG